MEIQLKYLIFFPCIWRIKLLNTSKTKALTFHMWLDIGRDNNDDYDDGELSYEDYYE